MSSHFFFLGGRDLEMQAISELLQKHAPRRFLDRQLSWGAKASEYEHEIEEQLRKGNHVVLVELEDDLNLHGRPRVVLVDHHGERAGVDQPTSLEQVFNLLKLPRSCFTRQHRLIAANDRGHVESMKLIGASLEEMLAIRAADRMAHGVTPEDESAAIAAAKAAQSIQNGKVTIVHSPTDRVSPITDHLHAELGGPGYENIVVFHPQGVSFFGDGNVVSLLRQRYPGGYSGGELPLRGFWGLNQPIDETEFLGVVTNAIAKF